MPVIRDPKAIEGRRGTIYPKEFAQGFERRVKRALTGPLGLTQFGVNLTTLEPGAMSAHRHWHRAEDEAIYVLEGEITLIDDGGETVLRAGMAAGFPAGDANGHHLVNRSACPATYLEIGTRAESEDATYPDIDLRGEKRGSTFRFFHKDGTPYT
ncbi:MAG: cupin domain-containing protein [Hyphomicrobiaceae bacterium]